MSRYHRYFVPGGTFFFTVVTENRAPLFGREPARNLLGSIMRRCFMNYPVEVIALVLLPDHLHTLWTLPSDDAQFSLRWSWIKGQFTRNWLASTGRDQPRQSNQVSEGRRNVWQRRFWEHTIRDASDLEAHFDYIHYNPVKYGLVTSPRDWPWSSFHRWVDRGHYPDDWGVGSNPPSVLGDRGE